jgi:hypothetical protein
MYISSGLQLQMQRPVLRILMRDGKAGMMMLSQQTAAVVVAIVCYNHTLIATSTATDRGESRRIQNLRRL